MAEFSENSKSPQSMSQKIQFQKIQRFFATLRMTVIQKIQKNKKYLRNPQKTLNFQKIQKIQRFFATLRMTENSENSNLPSEFSKTEFSEKFKRFFASLRMTENSKNEFSKKHLGEVSCR